MSGFVIFALVLTFAYVVYFAVQITLDLHGKKGEKSIEEEIYDVSDMTNEEQPVAVEERNDDPDLSVPTYTEHVTEDGLRVLNPTGKSVAVNSPVAEEPSQEAQTEQPVSSQELNEDNEALYLGTNAIDYPADAGLGIVLAVNLLKDISNLFLRKSFSI